MDNTIIILSIICCVVLILIIIFYTIYRCYISNYERQLMEQGEIRDQQSVITFNNLNEENTYTPTPPYDTIFQTSEIIGPNDYLEENINNDYYGYYQNDYYNNNYYDNSINTEGLNDYFNADTTPYDGDNYEHNTDFFNQNTYV